MLLMPVGQRATPKPFLGFQPPKPEEKMKNRKWNNVLAFTLFLIGTSLAQADPIKIGAFLAVTGPASFLGDPELKTLQMYVEEINAKGGVKGRKLELIHYDTGGNAKDAVSFVKRLIKSDNVDLLIGGTTTGDTMAARPQPAAYRDTGDANWEANATPAYANGTADESDEALEEMEWIWPRPTGTDQL